MRTSFFSDYKLSHPRLDYCTGLFFIEPDEKYSILVNGSLDLHGHYLTDDYCVDNIMTNKSLLTKVIRCALYVPEYMVNITIINDDEEKATARIFISTCGVISLICLCITFLIYSLLPGFNNLHGKIVQNNIVSITLITLYILITFNNRSSFNSYICIFMGYFGYFSSFAMFFWMSIMCFDLFWTFSRSELQSSTSGTFKFHLYVMTGWGLATLLTIILGILQVVLPVGSEFNPAIGENRCFIDYDRKSALYYAYGPMFLLMIFNVLIFLGIMILFFLAKKSTEAARSSTR